MSENKSFPWKDGYYRFKSTSLWVFEIKGEQMMMYHPGAIDFQIGNETDVMRGMVILVLDFSQEGMKTINIFQDSGHEEGNFHLNNSFNLYDSRMSFFASIRLCVRTLATMSGGKSQNVTNQKFLDFKGQKNPIRATL